MIDLRLSLIYYLALSSLWCFGSATFKTLAFLADGPNAGAQGAFSYLVCAVLLLIAAVLVGRQIHASISPSARV